jgi:hypothetical protein
MAVISAALSAPPPPPPPACPSASPAHRSINGARPTVPAPPSPSPALTPSSATTASSPSRVATMSLAARPYSPTGRSKAQRWASSCLASLSSSALSVGTVGSGALQRTFKDVLLLPPPQPAAQQFLPKPPHRPKFAVVQRPGHPSGTVRRSVPSREGWVRVEPRRRQLPPLPPPRRSIPKDLQDRCFNCLASSHRAADCRRSVRCFKCWGLGHRAVKCKVRATLVIKASVSVWDRLGPQLVHKPLDIPRRAMEWCRVSSPIPAIQRSGVAAPTLGGTKKRHHRTRGRRPKTAPVAPTEDSSEVAPPPGSSSPEPVRVHAPRQPAVPDMVEATHLCILDRADALAREELRL